VERLDLTGHDLPVDESVIAELVTRAMRVGLDILVIGAAARDLVIHSVVEQKMPRVTLDVDVAVAVGGHGDLESFVAGLRHSPIGTHTYAVHGVPVDVVPFGAIEHERHVSFSDEHELDVTGIAEALQTSVEVTLPAGTRVKVASLPAQAVLKVLAWRDRRFDSTKDARDLQTILAASSVGPYGDEAWEDKMALEATDYDIILAGPCCAGRLAAGPFDDRSAARVLAVLDDVSAHARLARDMDSPSSSDMLRAFTRGFRTGVTGG